MIGKINFSVLQSYVLSHYIVGGGGGSTTKKIMPPGKTRDVLCLFVPFQNTFKIDVFVSNLVKNVSSKKNKKDHDFCLFLSFLPDLVNNKISSNRE